MSDDWKGEAHIRRKPTASDRLSAQTRARWQQSKAEAKGKPDTSGNRKPPRFDFENSCPICGATCCC